MNGKELKVIENDLTFGSSARMVNVFGLFRYKPNNSLYVVYMDVGTTYSMVYYGSSHVKNNSILSMSCKEEDVEIIKEYIFKVTEQQELSNFDVLSLQDIEGIEIIASNRLEVKPEILNSLIELTIPKKEVVEVKNEKKSSKKKSPIKTLFIILIFICVLSGGYLYILPMFLQEDTVKNIICNKEYQHSSLDATVEENNVYSFNYQDTLEKIETTMIFKFDSLESYQDFINKGGMYKYMPDSDTNGGYSQDDENHTFTIITKENIGVGYQKPTAYEEVLSYYKKEGYSCQEKVLKE